MAYHDAEFFSDTMITEGELVVDLVFDLHANFAGKSQTMHSGPMMLLGSTRRLG
jgi:hypothetical protein